MKKILALLFILFVIVACKTTAPEDTEQVAALVNGFAITQGQLDSEFSSIPSAYTATYTKEKLLDDLISEELLIQEAEKNGYYASKTEIDTLITQMRFLNNMTQAQFEKRLVDQHSSIHELKRGLEKKVEISQFVNATLGSQVTVSDEELKNYYDTHKADFAGAPGQIRAAHILVPTQDEANQVIALYKKGVPFAELAKTYSTDTGSAVQGGELGFFDNATMVPEFTNAAFSLKPNQISGPIQTKFGFHIILRESDSVTFEEAKPVIQHQLKLQKGEAALRIYLQQLQSTASIEKINKSIVVKNQFRQIGKAICTQDGKPIVRAYTTSSCTQCESEIAVLKSSVPTDKFDVRILQLDTGDNLMTSEKESGIPKEDLVQFTNHDPQSFVPYYDIGCMYGRIGNAYKKTGDENAAFKEVLGKFQ